MGQFIERAGDYVLPVTLLWVLVWLRSATPAWRPSAVRPAAATPAPAARPRPAPVAVPANGFRPTPPPPAPSRPDPQVLSAAAALNARLAARRADPASRTSRVLVLGGDPTASS